MYPRIDIQLLVFFVPSIHNKYFFQEGEPHAYTPIDDHDDEEHRQEQLGYMDSIGRPLSKNLNGHSILPKVIDHDDLESLTETIV